MYLPGPGRPLVLVASDELTDDELSAVRRLQSEGARVVSWQHPIGGQDRLPSPDVDKYLRDRGLEAPPLAALLGERVNTEVDEALIAFMKELGRARLGELGSFREAFRYQGLSLWWWAELWLYYDTELRLHLRDVEALARLLERETPARLVLVAPLGELERIARDLFSEVQTLGETRRRERSAPRPTAAFLLELLKMLGTGLKSSLRGLPRRTKGAHRRVLCFTHASMWRKRKNPETGENDDVEMYFDRLIPRLEADGNVVLVVGVGPRDPFQRRGLVERLREMAGIGSKRLPYRPLSAYFSFARALEAAGAYWASYGHYRRLSRAPGLSEALTHRGVRLAAEGKEALHEAFLRLIPSAMRSFLEIRALLALERPDVFVLYAESTALGRAAVAAAASAHVPSFAIQHGIMYPFYYSHEHAPHEIVPPFDGTEGVPIPTRTAVFGRQAERLFIERGHYDVGRIVVTGSPKFDVLFQTRDLLQRSEIRSRLGLDDEARLLVVASRFSSIGFAFRSLLRAAEAIPSLTLLVKPHQAERPEPYVEAAEAVSSTRMTLVSPGENLLELIVASNGLVTVDSFASSEALVLGRPVLVLNLPNNLQMLVDSGLALGVGRGEDVSEALATILDPEWRRDFEARLVRNRDDFAYGADRRSTERILRAIYETADEKNG